MLKKVPFVPVRIPLVGDEITRTSAVKSLVATMNSHLDWNKDEVQNHIKVIPFALGLTNQLYKCELENSVKEFEKRNMEVMVRVFGRGSEQMLDREEELNIMVQVQEDYVKCRFENGIVVQFFPGECLRPLDLTEEKNQVKIAKRMAQLHKIQLVDLNSQPLSANWFDRVEMWLKQISQKLATFEMTTHGYTFTPVTLQQELELLRKNIEKNQYEKTCCHGDINAENCIYNEADDSLTFIDYEYACNFFRGFDIGNHFCEYAGVERNLDFAQFYPSESERRKFVEFYCSYYYEDSNSDEKVELMMKESNDGALLSNFFWGTWGLIQSTCSTLDFDFEDYGRKRLAEYARIVQRSKL